jgi:hypothetical protein
MVALQRSLAPGDGLILSAIDGGSLSPGMLIAEVGAAKHDVRPFDPGVLELCSALSRRLMRVHEHPEAVAVGFWMRPAAIAKRRADFETSTPVDQVAVARGLAFHVTPANVDTMFVYSWVLSLLVGNANIVRLSSRPSAVRTRILDAVAAVLEDISLAEHARRNRFILTDHDEAAIGALSAASDLRVIWGGDETIRSLRRFPTPVRGRDVVFPDRHSMALLDATSVAAVDEGALASLADRFFDDAFWFDQGGCSSPRLLLWRAADDAESTERAVRRFREAVLASTKRHGYEVETGMALNKMAFAADVAARIDGVLAESQANEITWVRLGRVADYERENCGGGLFFELVSEDVAGDMLTLVRAKDQTVTAFGFDRDELVSLVRRLNGRGVDRIVPVGQALAFDSTWDGVDLMVEFSRRVVVG